eukprot:TRINITY_DN579_c0_g4_i1.p1 TRINITY_DN579_c0_g4~~TRINITY_DN579_c0_g4_i1.p1  ORF type:complete len:186 (+),score=76.88 TRINITY_DN579_c0_g4_i1:216-773(+)
MQDFQTAFRMRLSGYTPVWPMVPKEDEPRTNEAITISHCFLKGVQAGGLIWYPIMAFMGVRRGSNIPKLMKNAGRTAFVMGSVVSGAAAYRLYTSTDTQNYDRAYRLQHNTSQNKVDWLSLIGGGLGGLTWMTLFGFGTLTGGIALGAGAGVIVHLVESVIDKPPKEAAKEIKEDVKSATEVVRK